jgi:Flp pilus assembly protein TadG
MNVRQMSGTSRGQTLVEFALVIPLVLLLFMGVFDFGRAIYSYNTISNAARDGARKAIVDQTVGAAAQEAAEQATALGLDPADTNQVQVRYLLPNLSGACPAEPSGGYGIGCIAEVRVQYTFRAITPVIGNVVGPIQLSTTTQIPVEATRP